jgi:DNA polymerase-3 subunit epsilon
MASVTFAALDVETADRHHEHVCAIGVVRVEEGRIVAEEYRLVRPPCPIDYWNNRVHGLTDADVADASSFHEVWAELRPLLSDVGFIGAHSAAFDQAVLAKSCRAARVSAPSAPFECTRALARDEWGIRPADLASVCLHLGIRLDRHHHAGADARAVAEILLLRSENRVRRGLASVRSRA